MQQAQQQQADPFSDDTIRWCGRCGTAVQRTNEHVDAEVHYSVCPACGKPVQHQGGPFLEAVDPRTLTPAVKAALLVQVQAYLDRKKAAVLTAKLHAQHDQRITEHPTRICPTCGLASTRTYAPPGIPEERAGFKPGAYTVCIRCSAALQFPTEGLWFIEVDLDAIPPEHRAELEMVAAAVTAARTQVPS